MQGREMKQWLLVVFYLVEDDDDDFPTSARPDSEYNHNNNGSKEKCESICKYSLTLHCITWLDYNKFSVSVNTIV